MVVSSTDNGSCSYHGRCPYYDTFQTTDMVVWKVSSQGSYHCQLFGRCRHKAATIVSCLEGVVSRQLPLSVVWKVSSSRQLPLSVVWKVSSSRQLPLSVVWKVSSDKAATIVSCLEGVVIKAATIVSCLEGVVIRQLPLSVVWKVSS